MSSAHLIAKLVNKPILFQKSLASSTGPSSGKPVPNGKVTKSSATGTSNGPAGDRKEAEASVGTLMYNREKMRQPVVPKRLAQDIRLLGRQFRVGRQEDSHEFLRCLLQKMHRETLALAGVKEGLPSRLDETDDLHRIFGGYFRNQLHCTQCGFDSNSYDAFMDLSLEVGNGINTVDKALKHFCAVETLDEQNKWKCPRCRTAVRAHKQMTIRVPPPVLTIQLKRFSFTPVVKPTGNSKQAQMRAMMMAMMGAGRKLTDKIGFEPELDLTAALSDAALKELRSGHPHNPRALYELHGVLVHHGSSPNSGHYFAYTKAANGAWFCMNDESCTSASWPMVSGQQAYMLFYSRKGSTVPQDWGFIPPTIITGTAARKASIAESVASQASGPGTTTAPAAAAAGVPKAQSAAPPAVPVKAPETIFDFENLTWQPGGGVSSSSSLPTKVTSAQKVSSLVIPSATTHSAVGLSLQQYGDTKQGRIDTLLPASKTATPRPVPGPGSADAVHAATGPTVKKARTGSTEEQQEAVTQDENMAGSSDGDDSAPEEEDARVSVPPVGIQLPPGKAGHSVQRWAGVPTGIGTGQLRPLPPAARLRAVLKADRILMWEFPSITSASCVPTFAPASGYLGLCADVIRQDFAIAVQKGLVSGGGRRKHLQFDADGAEVDPELEVKREALDRSQGILVRPRATAGGGAVPQKSPLQLQMEAMRASAAAKAQGASVGSKRKRAAEEGDAGSVGDVPEFLARQKHMNAFLAKANATAQSSSSDTSDGSDSSSSSDGSDDGRMEEDTFASGMAAAMGAPVSVVRVKTSTGGTRGEDNRNEGDSASTSSSDSSQGSVVPSSSTSAGAARKRAQLEKVVLTSAATGRPRSFDPSALATAPVRAAAAAAGTAFGIGGWGDSEDEDGGNAASASGAVATSRYSAAVPLQGGGGWGQTGGHENEDAAWNEALDAGKVKKVKDKSAVPSTGGTGVDLSHQMNKVIQNRVSKQSLLPGGKGYRKGHGM